MKRRDFVKNGMRTVLLGGIGVITGVLAKRALNDDLVWQLDPHKCTQCGKCATACIMTPSAVKCVHAFDVCGYCELCGGYHQPDATELDTAAENQLCPTGALKRKFVEEPYYEYTIVEEECIGCAKCVAGCGAFGNGSLYLQVRHDLCDNCNECAIAKVCPSDAFERVPSNKPYLLKGKQGIA
jgi:electron transport complex protein RnfB